MCVWEIVIIVIVKVAKLKKCPELFGGQQKHCFVVGFQNFEVLQKPANMSYQTALLNLELDP